MILLLLVLNVTPLLAQANSPLSTDLRAKAESGDARAQFDYGKALSDTSDPVKKKEAAAWLQKAGEQGVGDAWYWLGYAGLGSEQPVYYYKMAADLGHPEAFQSLEDELLFRAGEKADIREAKKYADLARRLQIKIDGGWGDAFATIDRCYEAGVPEIPLRDQPTPDEELRFQNSKMECASFLDDQQDWARYRKCQLSESAVDNNAVAEIYANGWGVSRNPKLAIALVCHASGVPAELIGLVDTLYTTKDLTRLEPDFRFCDHVTSGSNAGFCAAEAAKTSKRKRDKIFARLMSKWTPAQKLSFEHSREAANSYFEEHARSEQDMSGSMRGAIAIDEQRALQDEFLKFVQALERGKIPKDIQFKKADKELNVLYKAALAANSSENDWAVSAKGIQTTQRLWIAYRDAWVEFATRRYPKTAPSVWKTEITRQRSVLLKKLLPDTDSAQ